MLVKHYSFPLETETYMINTTDAKISIFLDIETTGFSRVKSMIYLIGCGSLEKNTMHITQWFNNDGKSEKEMLLSFLNYLESCCSSDFSKLNLITFNGERFDLPFLKEHFSMHGIVTNVLDDIVSLDLYRMLLPFQKAFGLKQGKQKNWEDFMGIGREDLYDGGQLISLYKTYLLKPEDDLLQFLLLHNYEDILGMGRISSLSIYDAIFQIHWTIKDMQPESFVDNRACIHLNCALPVKIPVPFFISQDDYAISGNRDQLDVYLCYEETFMKHYYKDYKNYYYLPKEDYAIHKSIGCYVDSNNRTNATASTCYIKKEGIFFQIPPKCSRNGYLVTHDTYDSKEFYQKELSKQEYYLEFGELFLDYSSTQSFLNQYLKDVFKYILISSK